MREVILCKYGEIVLKGLNKSHFENILLRDLKKRTAKYGSFHIHSAQSTTYIEPLDEGCDIDGVYGEAKRTFGFLTVSRAVEVEKDIGAICSAACDYIPQFMEGKSTFKVESKRADKRFPMTSPQISAEVGGALLERMPYLKVDVKNPQMTVKVEVREDKAYVHGGAEKGAGGLPLGTNGKALLLLSGGIDSPVAGYMMARRGVTIEALHFESFPYTSERAKEKVIELARLLTPYAGDIRLHIISLTHLQEEMRDGIDQEYFTLILRRSMIRLANRTAEKSGCTALVTGESLGQVASQTMLSLYVTDHVADRPVFRPCIGLDKEDIVCKAREINTFETSILPYEDCCTVFTPPHPKTRPELSKVEYQETKIPISELEDEAFGTLETIVLERD
ncbi:MAG: tRNA 4-thiouridine(8) synthase ThiI [Clostridia bacterium]|nr:tRNA 4-thiouridine(8) synthase ThiI [Clostridia bacterium]